MLAKVSPRENSLVFFGSELLMLQQLAARGRIMKKFNGFINNHDGSGKEYCDSRLRQNCRRPG